MGMELHSAAGSAHGGEYRSHLRIDGELGLQGERSGVLRPGVLHHRPPRGRVRIARIDEPGSIAGEDLEHRIEDLAHHPLQVVATLDRAVDAVHAFEKAQMGAALFLRELALGDVRATPR